MTSVESSSTSTKESTKTFVGDTYLQRKQNAVVLAAGYTKAKRASEILSVISFGVLLVMCILNLAQHFTLDELWMIPAAILPSMVLADLLSGLLHWGADTWGSLDTPLVGQTFIRSFREHHLDPNRMTYHDFIETNGDSCLATLGGLAVIAFSNIRPGHLGELYIGCFITSLAVWVMLTNQFHKWAHMRKPPALVALLQRYHIILPRKEHQIHHHTPFDRYYCITTGWLNPVLQSIGFWKRLEITITWLTGAQPRVDDAKWTLQQQPEEEGEDIKETSE